MDRVPFFSLAVTLTRQLAFLYVLVFIVCPFSPNFIRQLWMFTHEHSYDLGRSGRRGRKIITSSWPVTEVLQLKMNWAAMQLCCNRIFFWRAPRVFSERSAWLVASPLATLSRSKLLSSVSNKRFGRGNKIVSRKRKLDILICHLVMSVLQGVALPPLSVWPLPLMIDVLTLSTP